MRFSFFKNVNLLGLLTLLVVTSVLFSCKKDDEPTNLVQFKNIALTGANEVPAISTTGSGTFNGTYNKDTKVLTYTIAWSLGDPAATTTGMHFHGPATVTENKPVRIGITGFPTGSTNQVFSSSTPALDATQEAELLGGKWYLNIHSSTHPSGELRGQLVSN